MSSHSQYRPHSHPQPHPQPQPHLHSNIHTAFVPSLGTLRRCLKEHGFLEIGLDYDRIKFARAGSIIYVPNAGADNYDGFMRMALLQLSLAEGYAITLDLPEELRA